MIWPRNEKGFTLIEMLVSLVILTILSALIMNGFLYLKKDLEIKTSINKMEWEIFLLQLNKDIRASSDQAANRSTLTLFVKDKTITIEKYQDKLRRRLDGSGHEILLQNIKSFSAEMEGGGIRIKAGDKKGNMFDAYLKPFKWEEHS